jgi:hypothetical protein
MSYCRFENTSNDVWDCIDAIRDQRIGDMSDYEIQGFLEFVRGCKEVAEIYSHMSESELKEYINDYQK